ncbi:Protein of unknown function [Shimia gijangensis]|uniref:DUF3572 domain-containing protein n=1 Tax=Shimia gijangensis TaxID=1470563 RepID=A0A1M6LK35_9RHOB|nr:DUF3572 domain-containing protein [Shimia gijangensis]SHJ71515.1 Protein of unknown function [Shimia gijangensis]
MVMTKDVAETLALKALAWLVTNDELLPVFLGSTGASVGDLKTQAATSDFQVSVLEFLTMDDAWVMAFCDSVSQAYEAPMEAAQVLAGQSRRHWT